jgi:WD40 repeat protein
MLKTHWSFVLTTTALGLLLAPPGRAQAPKPMRITAKSPDGKVVAVAEGNAVRFFNRQTSKLIRRLVDHKGRVTSIAFSPDGRYFASGGVDKAVQVYKAPTAELLWKRQVQAGVTSVVFEAGGKTIVIRTADQKKLTCDPATGKLISEANER